LREPDVDAALHEVAGLIGAGIDLIHVEVPIGRELADRMTDAGLEVPRWTPRDSGSRPADNEPLEPAPTGSQRALARLRRAVDRAAAKRRAYVRLATSAPALGAPEGAVVAAFERIDLIASDPMSEVVANAVEPDRALSDHAFAHRLASRAGTAILVGPGPLVVAPDLVSGIPSDPATRAGRALALQLLGVMLARDDGLATEAIIVGALTPWLTDEQSPGARAIAEVAVRRVLFEGHPLGFVEPPIATEGSALWPYVEAAAAAHAGNVALVLCSAGIGADGSLGAIRAARAGSTVSADVAGATRAGPLTGVALDHARGMVAAAEEALERLADEGWRTLAGDPPSRGPSKSAAFDAATERTESFDAFEATLGRRV